MATLSADLVETACALESRFSALLAVLEEKLYRDFAALQAQLSGLSLEATSCKAHDDMARVLVPLGSSPSLASLAAWPPWLPGPWDPLASLAAWPFLATAGWQP